MGEGWYVLQSKSIGHWSHFEIPSLRLINLLQGVSKFFLTYDFIWFANIDVHLVQVVPDGCIMYLGRALYHYNL